MNSRRQEKAARGWMQAESLEKRALLSVAILNGGGSGYDGAGGGAPPDVTGAAGPNIYLLSSNSSLVIHNKATGAVLDSHYPGDFFFNPSIGNEALIDAGSGNNADCTMVFDNLMGSGGRFIIGDINIDTTTNVSQYVFAVSKSNNPTTLTTADWNFYHVVTTEGSGSNTSWSDYPGNPGYNADAVVETFNMFGSGPGGCQVVTINAADLANGVSQASLHYYRNDVPGGLQNYRPTTMQDAVAGGPMWLIHSPGEDGSSGNGTSLDVVKVTNVLSNSASFTSTALTLPSQDDFVTSGSIGNPLNPDDVSATDGDDLDNGNDSGNAENPDGVGSFDPGSRILKASEYNNIVVSSQSVSVAAGTSSLASAQPNDKNGKPSGGVGYSVGNTLTVVGGVFTTAAQLRVSSVGAGGTITSVSVVNPGNYSNLSTVSGAPTGGSGSGASFSLFFTGELVAQWYAVDVSSGTPVFQTVGGTPNVGRMGYGDNTYCFEPSISINSHGEIGMGFMESDTLGGAVNSATGGYISTFVTGRLPTDPAGTMQSAVLVPAGRGTADINGRIGDFSGMSVDPVNGTFWHDNEFGGGGPTDIANFYLSTLTVTNTNDSGIGSLRQAISDANFYNEPESIIFDIPTSDPNYAGGVFTIKPATLLPTITDANLTIDGNTQESFTGSTNGGRPVIFLVGSSSVANGLVVSASSVNIKNLGVDSFPGTIFGGGGIVLTGVAATYDFVGGCLIGVGPNGTSAAGNDQGVDLAGGATGDLIGSTTSGFGNVIGDNTTGVAITNASYELVYGNDIGLTAALGSAPNGTGVYIANTGSNISNTIGDDIIGDNTGNGILISGSNSQSNFIQGCDIGVTYSSSGIIGYFGAANGGDGILLNSGTTSNLIGGTTTGAANVIAGNAVNGIEFDNASGNTVEANTIGFASHSIFSIHGITTTYYPNLGAGIDIHDGASSNSIGSATAVNSPGSAANVISDNGTAGISMADNSTINNTVYGDYIGTDSSSDAIGNAHEGVIIFADQETVSGCVISNNGFSGLSLPGFSNNVTNNLIGTNVAGSAALGNSHEGIYINGPGNLVQGDTISGNAYTGITIAATSNTVIKGNDIGTNSAGTAAIANQQQGILASGSGQVNSISGNVISGNALQGISLGGSLDSVYGNYIGTNYNGSAAIPNVTGGIYVNGNGQSIGFAGSGNVISGNTTGYGIELDTSAAYSNSIAANYIGTNAGGTAALANTNGIVIQNGANNNSIGATTSGGANVVSGNSNDGIYITTANSSANTIVANFIGTNGTGTAAIGNGFDGVEINASSNTIGGTAAAARNIISGNSNRDGVVIEGSGITGDIVQGNYIGTNAAGTAAIANSSGIEVISNATGAKLIGNVISGNSNRGVGLFGSSSTSSTVQGDLIGTDYTGLQPVGNGGAGIFVSGDDSVIGGYNTSQGDTVGFNAGGGINISSSSDTTVTDSTIYNNSNSGINNADTLYLYNCTITGNTATSGAGIYTTGTMQIYDSTIAKNSASSSGGGINVVGGLTLLTDSIVAQNTGGDVTGALYSTSYYNLIGDGTGLTGITSSTPGDQIGTHAAPIDPLLGPLASNGGNTQTMAPKAGSPALNAGSGGTSSDQRDLPRPSSPNDIGAVQLQSESVSISGAAIYLRLESNGQTLDVYYNNTGTGTPSTTYLLPDIASLSASGTSGNDQITLDYSNGVPIPPGSGFSYNGLGGTNTMKVIGTAANDVIGVNATTFTVGSSTAAFANVQTRIVDPGGGSDSLTIAAGLTVSFPAAAPGTGILSRNLSTGSLGSSSKLIVSTSASNTDRTLLIVQTPTLSTGATIDLGNSDADFPGTTLSSVNAWAKTGYNAGAWTGPGIDSAAAATDSTHLTALGVVQNNQGGTPLFSGSKLFDGIAPGSGDVLVKYTYYGDANLDGKVDGSDYSRIDAAFVNNKSNPITLTGWYNGDFNYDGVVDGTDYTLIDNAFNAQGAILAAELSAPNSIAAQEVAIPAAVIGSNSLTLHAKPLNAHTMERIPARGFVAPIVFQTATPITPTELAGADVETLLLKKDLLETLTRSFAI